MIYLFLVGLAIVVLYLVFGRKKTTTATTTTTNTTNGARQLFVLEAGEVRSKTAAGLNLIAKSVISAEKLQVIDSAMLKLFADAKQFKGYTEGFDPSLYTVRLKNDCELHDGVWRFLTRADDYDGSTFDKNPAPSIGEIYAAEKCEDYVDPQTGRTVLTGEYTVCDTEDFALLANTIRFGLEHNLGYRNGDDSVAYVNHGLPGAPSHPLIQES